MAKHGITQTMPDNGPGTVFFAAKDLSKIQTVSHLMGSQMQVHRNVGAIGVS